MIHFTDWEIKVDHKTKRGDKNEKKAREITINQDTEVTASPKPKL